MQKRFNVLLGLLLTIMLMVSACSSGGSGDTEADTSGSDATSSDSSASDESATTSGGSEEDKEIVFWNINTEEPMKTIVQDAVDRYNANTQSGYHITNVSTQNDTYKEKLVIAMSSGQGPDMYITWSGGPMNEYIDSGFGQPITEYVNNSEWGSKIMDASLAQASYKGDIYAVPMGGITLSGVWYNKEMFAKYGLEVPKTIAELEAVCDTLVANGITPFALANASKWTGSMYFMNLATRYGGLEPFQEAAAGTGSFENDAFVFAGEKIQEWVSKGYFPEGVNSLSEDDGQSRQLLYQEAAAMTCIGSWYASTMPSESEEFYNEKMGWFLFPELETSDADQSLVIGTVGDNFITMNCEGEKLDAAMEFFDYYWSEEGTQALYDAGRMPAVEGVADHVTDPNLKDVLNASMAASGTQLWYDQYLPPAVAEVHKDTCQELFGLTMTPQEANAALQAAMESSLAE